MEITIYDAELIEERLAVSNRWDAEQSTLLVLIQEIPNFEYTAY